MILVITAPSGAGKTTLIHELFKILPNLKFSVSATTREKRSDEKEGIDYYFISEAEFRDKIKNGDFVEWEKVHDHKYGTLKSELERYVSSKQDVILDIDVNGALNIKKLYPDSLVFFINVPKEELIARLEKRKTESEEEITKRTERIDYEISLRNKFDHVIENSSGGLKKAVNEIVNIINKNKKK